MIDGVISRYQRAAAAGSLLELKLRMLCEAVPALQGFAHVHKLEDVEEQVVSHFAGHLSVSEKALLASCRQLRNKILHCDFRAARERLTEAGAAPGSGQVRFIKLDPTSVTANEIRTAIQNVPSSFRSVADTSSTEEGTVFGWLLELGASGDFELAAKTFQGAVALLDRLAQVNSDVEVARVLEAGT
jgi:hypothetical protein